MHVKITVTVNVWEPYKGQAEATLVLKGEQVQSVRLSQWLEQTMSRLCKEIAQCLEPGELQYR